MSTTEADKITSIFNLYTKYRYRTYNNIISSDSQIFKFKERVNNYNKIFGDMESKKFVQKEPESIQIMVKEGKEKKVYTEEFDTIPEEEEEEKTVIEKPADAKPVEKKPGEKPYSLQWETIFLKTSSCCAIVLRFFACYFFFAAKVWIFFEKYAFSLP